jgi:cytochrome c oxidase cbb3-type subunit 2
MATENETAEFQPSNRGIWLVAVTYVYFLIFAQFGFLKRLKETGIVGQGLKVTLGAMALSGLVVSLLVFRFESVWDPTNRLRAGFCGCAAGAMLSLLPLNLFGGAATAALVGGSLGLLTVTLVTHLDGWTGRQPFLSVGCGVGLAYFVCNVPPLFEAKPSVVALCSAALCLVALSLPSPAQAKPDVHMPAELFGPVPPYLVVLACFTGLIWLDSAAFYIIQNTAVLKAGTWEGARRLWENGTLHLAAGLAGAQLLRRRGLLATLALAFSFLGAACLCLGSPAHASWAPLLYPIGVSLYSVALVAYPSFFATTTSYRDRAWKAGWLYAVAGWIGSTLGIGMGEDLRRIPAGFVLGAALLVFVPALGPVMRRRWREALTLGCFLASASLIRSALKPRTAGAASPPSPTLITCGRQVYISEGCLHCHSQYVRPETTDESMWGVATDLTKIRSERPPLIGNRRQGPDLANVGSRRSPLWLRAHFMDPSQLSYGSIMPSYRYLFEDDRGEALVAFVTSLKPTNCPSSLMAQSSWHLPKQAWAHAKDLNRAALFTKHCATCHALDGLTRRTWFAQFKRIPPDFAANPLIYVPTAASPAWRLGRIATIIKFGLPGTDMPGHEYLPDEDIAALARQVVAGGQGKP